jgi:EmrB/QacA subfamily drug resistance transporter
MVPPRSARLALTVLCASQFMLIVDVVVLNVALPSIQRGLAIPVGQLQLAGVAYTLTFGSLLIVAGRAGDLLGRRRIFRLGLLVFTAASALAAVAQTGWQLFAGRALQGVGAAMVSPTTLALLTSLFPEGNRRNRALGLWAAMGSAGAICGQVLGGLLTDAFGWRSIFLINLPVGVLAILVAGAVITETRAPDRTRLDLGGAVLLATGLTVFSLALTEPRLDPVAVAEATVAVVLLGGFVAYERRHPEPLVRFSILRNRGVRAGNTVLALLGGTTAAALFFTTLHLQGTLGFSAAQVGAAFAPVTLIVLVVSPLASRLVGRVGARTLLVAGSAVSGVGLLHLALAGGSFLTGVLPGLASVALGNGLAFAPTMIAATSGVDEHAQGLASGLLTTSQELGTAMILATVVPITAAAGTGYRTGFLVAAGLVAVAVLAATRTPRGIGQTERKPADAPTAC